MSITDFAWFSVPAGCSVGSVCGEDAANILIYTETSFSELTCGNTAIMLCFLTVKYIAMTAKGANRNGYLSEQ